MPDPTLADIAARLDALADIQREHADELKRIADALPPYLLGLKGRQEEIERERRTDAMLREHHARRQSA